MIRYSQRTRLEPLSVLITSYISNEINEDEALTKLKIMRLQTEDYLKRRGFDKELERRASRQFIIKCQRNIKEANEPPEAEKQAYELTRKYGYP